MPAHIIVAEDDPASLYALRRILEQAGYEVAAFSSGLEAWDALGRGQRVDLLVADIHFPGGQPDGSALARHGRQHHRGMLTIFVTGFPDLIGEIPTDLGPVLLKPVDAPALVSAVRAALPGRSGGEPDAAG